MLKNKNNTKVINDYTNNSGSCPPIPQFLDLPVASGQLHKLRLHSRTGRPLGDRAFLKSLERKLHIPLLPHKPGPKPKPEDLKHAEKQNQTRGHK